MTDEGQLDFDGLQAEEPKLKKPPRKRRAAKAKSHDALAAEPTPEAQTPVEGGTPHEASPDPAPVFEVEPGQAPVGKVPEDVTQTESEGEFEALAAAEAEASSAAVQTGPVAEDAAAPTPPRLFFLTNRMNMNGVLSSRMLAPRGSFHKYYGDLLDLAPGWVPILNGPPAASLIEHVIRERGAGSPVLVELSDSVLNGQPAERPIVYLCAALFSDFKAIHFRDRKSLREHRARGYSNVHPHDDLLQVSPELFASDAGVECDIAPPEEAPATDWLHLDRVRGAVGAAVAASDSGESLAVAAGLLGATELPRDTILPPWLTWTGLNGEMRAPFSETDAELADRLIFQAAYRVLGRRDQAKAWSPMDVLETVEADINAAKPREEAQAIVDRNLQRIRELVNIERDFEPFRNPGSPYVAAKSFLMVLLRPDLGQLLDWSQEETGADETTRVVAAVLAGRLRGLAREFIGLRSLALDDLTAAWAVRAAHGHTSTLGIAEFSTNKFQTSLLLDGQELCTLGSLIPDPVPAYEALDADARHSARIRVSRTVGWPVEVRVHLPAGADVQPEASVITIISTDNVTVETVVDEPGFLARLERLSGQARRQAVAALVQ